MTYTSDYPIINVTVDLALFRVNPEDHTVADVLLIERRDDPYAGRLALPGGFLNYEEKPADAAARECVEETNVKVGNLSFVGMLDEPDRDPRGRVISYLFAGWLPSSTKPKAGDDAADARWVQLKVARQQNLAFDHKSALNRAAHKMQIPVH